MRLPMIALAAILAPGLALADVNAIVDAGAKACLEMDNGTFTSEGAVRQIDLTGDGTADDTVVDEALFKCSTSASLYGGTGGSVVHFLVGDTQTDAMVLNWDTARWNDNLLILMARHGTECGGVGSDPCYEALVWNGERFMAVRPAEPVQE